MMYQRRSRPQSWRHSVQVLGSKVQLQGAVRFTCMKMLETFKELIAVAVIGIESTARGF